MQVIVEVTVAGVPGGTPKAAVLIKTDVDLQCSPAVASDCVPASRPALAALSAERARDAARAAVWAASLTVVRANHSRPPATNNPSVKRRAGTSRVSSTAAAPRWSRSRFNEPLVMAQ